MIGNSLGEKVWVVSWVTILRSIAPICMIYCGLAPFLPQTLRLPRIIMYWLYAETYFYIAIYFYRKHYLQRPATHPLPTSKEERSKLFELCLNSTQDHESYVSKWFLGAPLSAIKKDNLKEFFRWAFLDTGLDDPNDDEELEMYVENLEEKLPRKIPDGRSNVKSLRLTLDNVDALHRSLTWYMCIFVVDSITHVYLRMHNFRFYRGSASHSLRVLPPRPQAFVASQRSPSPELSYWYQPHTAQNELPILFLHGIGVGLYPYMEFLKELNQGRQEEEGRIGILAVEFLSISSRLTSPMRPKAEMSQQIRRILDRHHFHRFVLASHSYGSVVSTHLLKTPDLASRIAATILVDPISILLNQPDVAYNFTIRKPKLASEWLLWYFGSKDIGVAHTLSRTFFWSENILWKEDLKDHRCLVFLGEKDSVINAAKVHEYLRSGAKTSEDTIRGFGSTSDVPWRVVWCPGLDHGQVFDLPEWRARLKDEILKEARRNIGASLPHGVAQLQ